ncbi:MFS transporter [Actinosynnema sp. NPDC047251]|uniref:Permease, MFS-type n=1 Tax=Saccharothrix espanaensis (strain ATCC 51144 / DSM 44229 / JCM 9112 / NBRC 15066 / NRRL 15764) TaxID=1179773 RepID=K0JTC1_SACES|nr:MFS transporter [Saccharothrix espanaensis]CCH29126.1 Permease, MFS-type [Saccharothrix espanaensis DSM 44229]
MAYLGLFAARGAVAFTAAGFFARLPLAMTGIGVITMLSRQRGEYALAGGVAASLTLAMAVLGPQVSRLVDRHGQRRVLLPAAGIGVGAQGALILGAHHGAPAWALFACAVPAGCAPNMAAMVRARWAHLYRGTPALHTALSFESVVDELTFVVGPALAVALSTTAFPEAGPLVAVVLLAVGVLWFAALRGTEPPVRVDGDRRGRSAIRDPGVALSALVLLAGGVIVGTVDVVSVAFAHAQGQPAAAGIVLSAYAVGSAVAGLVFGAVRTRWPLPRLLVLGTAGTALTTVPFLVVSDVLGLSVAVFAAGVFFAPTMIVVLGLVERIVPPARLTEGMTWAVTGLSGGVAVGAALSGRVVDAFGAGGGFAVAIGAGAVAVVIAAVGRPVLARVSSRAGDA